MFLQTKFSCCFNFLVYFFGFIPFLNDFKCHVCNFLTLEYDDIFIYGVSVSV